MHSRSFACAFGAILLAASHTAGAIVLPNLTINIDTEIVQMDLSGTGSLPLGPGYATVNSQVDFSESTSLISSGTTSLFIDLNSSTGSVSSSFNFFLDLNLTDIDAGADYAAGLGSSISIAADAAKPLSASVSGDVSFDLLARTASLTHLVSSAPPIERALGVDVNGNSILDSIFYSLMDLSALVDSLDFDAIDPYSASAITTVDPATGEITHITVNTSGAVAITSAALTMDGSVADTMTDPPFSIDLVGPVFSPLTVPEPGTLLLLSLGLAGFGIPRIKAARSAA